MEKGKITKGQIITFINTYGVKVEESEDCDYVELMMDNHKCITFESNEYYINKDLPYQGIDLEIYEYFCG